jgi:adenylosuccinate synthase
MWNAYHLMSNRARAVCYATRNTQFRALTELTVNKLMQSAHSQIEALTSLKVVLYDTYFFNDLYQFTFNWDFVHYTKQQSQDRLEEQTTEALSSLSEGNKVLLEQQQNLKDVQITAYKLVTTNLRELNNEKALIRSGHTQLATMYVLR